MIIKTHVLNSITTIIGKCIRQEKIIPLSNLTNLNFDGNRLTVTSSDGANYIKMYADAEGDPFEATLLSDDFFKLVKATDSEAIKLNIDNDKPMVINFKGNGNYKLSLPPDSEGKKIVYPNYMFDSLIPKSKLNLSDIKIINNVGKLGIYRGEGYEALKYFYSYHEGSNIKTVTGNGDIVTVLDGNLCGANSNILLPEKLLDRLVLFNSDDIYLQLSDNKAMFSSDNMNICWGVAQGKYPIELVNDTSNMNNTNHVSVSKSGMLDLLGRMSIFSSKLEHNDIVFNFNKSNIKIENPRGEAEETIGYLNGVGESTLRVALSCTDIISVIKALDDEEIFISYSQPKCVEFSIKGQRIFVATIGE